MTEIKALMFDVFGTVVDWRSGVAREAETMLAPKGYAMDWPTFASAWRKLYVPAMADVIQGRRPFVVLDQLHRETLMQVLAERGIADLSEAEIYDLTRAWHRLDPWPDVIDGLTRLKARYALATLSNGNIALIVNMAKRAGLPWDVVLGSEFARAFKPMNEAYDRAARALDLKPAECLMVAAHADDLRAAAGRGYKTAYVHRPMEFGPHHADRGWPADRFDIAVENFSALADRLGA